MSVYLALPEMTFELEWSKDPTTIHHILEPSRQKLRKCVTEELPPDSNVVVDVVGIPEDMTKNKGKCKEPEMVIISSSDESNSEGLSENDDSDEEGIAYAVCEKENTETWKWFLNLLKTNLDIERLEVYTMMNDRQKDLENVVGSVFNGVDVKFCVRHLHSNFKKDHSGLLMKQFFGQQQGQQQFLSFKEE
ncbi:uncharacterized protein LOC133780269 [Humulus lupulus]|uniref:uncharacterized protein LOC133780269 n=1 Tax=Humulus lupulus TaxID=3486 RepID=UPI002B416C6B|nr:uncharacterized protein LOC133780269 [Humulus lupulus]